MLAKGKFCRLILIKKLNIIFLTFFFYFFFVNSSQADFQEKLINKGYLIKHFPNSYLLAIFCLKSKDKVLVAFNLSMIFFCKSAKETFTEKR